MTPTSGDENAPEPDPTEAAEEEAPRGSFEERVTSRRVDLIEMIEKGIPPIEYLAGSAEIIIEGARHYLPAPKKSGKSFGALSLAVGIALAGKLVVILDRENGQRTYARRLGGLVKSRALPQEDVEQLRENLRYYAFPSLAENDHPDLVETFGHADLVIFDSSRMFLADGGFKENESDDYAAFMATRIDPLHRKHVATLILDNTGWENKQRGRGSSAKHDLNEVILTLKKERPFDARTEGLLSLEIAESRHGNFGDWTMEVGAGKVGSWIRKQTGDADEPRALSEDLLVEVCRVVGDIAGIGARDLREKVTGFRNKEKDAAVAYLAADGYIKKVVGTGPGYSYFLKRTYQPESAP